MFSCVRVIALLFALLAPAASAQVIPSGPWGSLNYWGVGGASQVLNPGLAGQCLQTQGVGSAPIWVACPGSALNLLPSINTNQFYCNTSGQFAPPVGCDVNTILNTVGYDIARPPTVESIIYKSNVGPTFNWQALPPGVAGTVLASGGPTNPPFWTSVGAISLASICQTVGAVLYFDTPSLQWKCLNPGTAGQVLQTGGASGNPSWLSLSATAPLSYTNGNFTTTTGTLTSANDTNVTIALGGTPTNALFNPVSLTMGWTGTLAAGRLNANVVQSFTNDTNVTASISAQNATLGWTGTLAPSRGGFDQTAWTAFTPSLTCGTATFTLNSARSKTQGKTTFIELDFTISAIGTCTNTVSFTLPATANSGGGMAGRELVNIGKALGCGFAAAATTATCSFGDLTAFLASSHAVVSGVYENQ